MLYERLLQPLLFRLDAERAHEAALGMLSLAQAAGTSPLLRLLAGFPPKGLETTAFGIRFPNPLGLAAGFDKDAALVRALSCLGFGFVEVGSITLRPQPGNPRPRMFRLKEHEAVINRMGFNSRGASAAAERLAKAPRSVPIGINLGLNKDCPKDAAPQQYAETFRLLKPFGDYFVVNVSSPNTSGLRDLQAKRHLDAILQAIRAENPEKKPVLVKLSPDLTDNQLDDALDTAAQLAAGVVASNTTISRPGLPGDMPEIQGGLSGRPLRALSTELIRKIRARSPLPIIGVGGVFTGADVLEKLEAGACLVQIYTSFVYRGPSAAVRILRELEAARKS